MSIAFHQNTQQQTPQPQPTEEVSGTEQDKYFVDSVQSSVGFDVGTSLLIGAFVVTIVLIGLLVKFAKPKQEVENEASSDDATTLSGSEKKEQTEAVKTTDSTKSLKAKKKPTRRQRKNQK